jgi:beta-glucosidase
MRHLLHYCLPLALLTACSRPSASVHTTLPQPELGYRTARLLRIDGYQFKDLNKNGQLDPYEDWRLSHEARARDLRARMSLEQKAGFMLISSTRLENDWSFEAPRTRAAVTSNFNENDLWMETNMFTKKPLDEPNLTAAGTTRDVTQLHKRHFILRAKPSARIIAEWANRLQALCESDGLGIPAIVTSNPRNHITMDASIGLSVGTSSFSVWPGELGLAAMRDSALTREFADIARQEWRAVGLRKGYMYMADLSTEPRWQRVEGTFGEDAALAATMIREVVLGFQGQALGPQSVALTTKHFPGGGATEGGQDPHFDWGKRELFTGGEFERHLIPFKAAIEAGSSSIMPYYSIPIGTPYEEVAYAYNKAILQDLLRGQLGFRGIINSDTGPIDMMPWGVETLSIVARYKRALEAGINLFSGTADPARLIETLQTYPALMPLVDQSVELLLLEKFRLGLFENPYVDVDAAERIVGNAAFQARADLAHRKSIVLLRNEPQGGISRLPLKPGSKVYFETLSANKPAGSQLQPAGRLQGIDFVATPAEADLQVIWLIPRGQSLFDSDGSPLLLSLSKNGIDTDYLNRLIAAKPTILVVNYSNPWVIDEVYPRTDGQAGTVLATFNTTRDALLDVLSGAFVPQGRMPFSTPSSEAQAAAQEADVPGYMEKKAGYSLFHFDEGIVPSSK